MGVDRVGAYAESVFRMRAEIVTDLTPFALSLAVNASLLILGRFESLMSLKSRSCHTRCE